MDINRNLQTDEPVTERLEPIQDQTGNQSGAVNSSKPDPRANITEQEFLYAQDVIRKLSDYFDNKVVGQKQLKFSLVGRTYSYRIGSGPCQDNGGQSHL